MTEEEILKDEAGQKMEEAEKFAQPEEMKFREADESPAFSQSHFQPETQAETIRKSGLAYSAGLVLAGSVIFLLIVGWILDSFLGTSPWFLVGGIILGSIIGFYQFFRLTSKILKP